MSDDKMAAANQITSADVNEHAQLLAKLTDIRRQKDAHFKPMAIQLAKAIGSIQAVQLTLANLPRVIAQLHQTEVEAMAVLQTADQLIAAEVALLKA